jgi:hypothetical protein
MSPWFGMPGQCAAMIFARRFLELRVPSELGVRKRLLNRKG